MRRKAKKDGVKVDLKSRSIKRKALQETDSEKLDMVMDFPGLHQYGNSTCCSFGDWSKLGWKKEIREYY